MRIKNERFKSVKELVRKAATEEETEFVEEFERLSAERQIIKHIMGLRAAQDKSQADMAEAMGCTQSRISKLESDKDDNLRLGDLHGYLSAIGFDLQLVMTRQSMPIAQVIKLQWKGLLRSLKGLSELCGDDAQMNKEVAKIYKNLASEFLETLMALSHKFKSIDQPKPKGSKIRVLDIEQPDLDDEPAGNDSNCVAAP